MEDYEHAGKDADPEIKFPEHIDQVHTNECDLHKGLQPILPRFGVVHCFALPDLPFNGIVSHIAEYCQCLYVTVW